MKNLLTIPRMQRVFVAALLFALMNSQTYAQSAWSGNGHTYEAVYAPGLTWAQAQAACAARGGYLATITSAEENDFVKSLFENNPAFWYVDGFNNALGPWTGGIQASGSSEPGGGWGWVNGEPFAYTNWSSHDPDNCCGLNQNRIIFIRDGNVPPTRWTDVEHFAGFVRGYIFESSSLTCVPPSGLVSWWSGDGNSNDMMGSNHGMLQNGATFVSGMVGQAFSFDGADDGINIQKSSNLDFGASDFSIGAWVNFTEDFSDEGVPIFLNYAGLPFYGLFITPNGELPQVYFRDGFGNDVLAEGTMPLNDGNWHYLVGMRDGQNGHLYVDGTLVATASNPSIGTITTSTCTYARIGAANTGPGHCSSPLSTGSFFKGLIDEVEVYNRALTIAEIQAIYNAGSAGHCQCVSPPTADAGTDKAICPNQSVQIGGTPTGSGGIGTLTFSWTPTTGLNDATLANPTAAPTSTTEYTVEVTDANGCNATDKVIVTVNTLPTAIVSGDASIFVGGSATISVDLTGAAPWSITWSDGITQSGIASSPATRVVSPSSTTTYTVTSISDANCTGTPSGSATVTVDPQPAGSNEVVLATNSVWLKDHAKVLSGNVVVNNASSGPMLDSQVELSIGQSVTTPAGFALKANRIKVKQGAVVASDIFYTELTNNGTISGSQNTPLALPVFASLPPFHQASPGTQDITVNQNESITLTAGAYRDILVKQNGTILFTGGGTFAIRSLSTGAKAKLLFDSPTEILIAGKLDTDENSYVGPQSGSGLGAADIVFYIAGSNGNNGNFGATPKAAQLGLKNTVHANFYVPNGTLWLRQGAVAIGAFLGRDVIVGEQVQVTLESAFTGGSSLAKSANDESGQKKLIAIVIPEGFALLQNYPNPFWSAATSRLAGIPSTMISFVLPEAGKVTVSIYSETGQLVRTLVDNEMPARQHVVSWNGLNASGNTVAAGVYLYRLVVQKQNGETAFIETRRMTLLK